MVGLMAMWYVFFIPLAAPVDSARFAAMPFVITLVDVCFVWSLFFFFQAEDGIRDHCVTGVQTCALPISGARGRGGRLSHQTVCVPGALGAPQGPGAAPARAVAGPAPDCGPRGRSRYPPGAASWPADHAQREGVRPVGAVRPEPGTGAGSLHDYRARVGRQPRPVRESARGDRKSVATQDRRRL